MTTVAELERRTVLRVVGRELRIGGRVVGSVVVAPRAMQLGALTYAAGDVVELHLTATKEQIAQTWLPSGAVGAVVRLMAARPDLLRQDHVGQRSLFGG